MTRDTDWILTGSVLLAFALFGNVHRLDVSALSQSLSNTHTEQMLKGF